jgi:hypothetical protein
MLGLDDPLCLGFCDRSGREHSAVKCMLFLHIITDLDQARWLSTPPNMEKAATAWPLRFDRDQGPKRQTFRIFTRARRDPTTKGVKGYE